MKLQTNFSHGKNLMITIEIPLLPVPWAAHQGFGRKSFNPRYKEREAYQWYIRSQWKEKPHEEAVSVFYDFYMPIPKSISKKKLQAILNREIMHTSRADVSNMLKFTEDCLKGIVFLDDAQVWQTSACKLYDLKPRVLINIFRFDDEKRFEGRKESSQDKDRIFGRQIA